MLQNATSLRKSPPWPPNISDEHVSCIAPATRHASLQILFTCPTPANSLKLLQNFHVFRTFSRVQNPLRLTNKTLQRPQVARTCGALSIFTSKCASRHNDLHFFNITIPKSAPKLRCFVHFDFDMCFAPQRLAFFRHLNFQKCSEPRVLCTFWLGNLLRATTACTFSTSQPPKVLRRWGALHVVNSNCAAQRRAILHL